MQDIVELTRNGTWNDDILEMSVESILNNLHKTGAYDLAVQGFAQADHEEFTPTSAPGTLRYRRMYFKQPNWMIDGISREKYITVDPSITRFNPAYVYRRLTISGPKTLREFQELWDALNEPHVVIVPREVSDTFNRLEFQNFTFQSWQGRWTKATGQGDYPSASLVLGSIRKDLRQKLPGNVSGYAYFVSESFGQQGFFTVSDFKKIPFDPQEALIQRFPEDRHPVHGTFRYSFRALDSLTKGYQSLELQQFDAILESEQSRTGESFEAFGVKFPAEGTTRWGILVVLGIQLYFFIHLRELAGKLNRADPGWDVAWIGVYDSRLAKAVFVFSAFVLPVLALAALGVRGLYISDFGKSYWVILCLGLVADTALASAGWKYSLKLHEQAEVPSVADAN